MDRVTENLTLLLIENQQLAKPSTPQLATSQRVAELMKNEAAVYATAPPLTKAQASMRLLLLGKLADEHGLPRFEMAFMECLADCEFRPAPALVKKKLLESTEVSVQKAVGKFRPTFKPLPFCTTACGSKNGALNGQDGDRPYWYPCECLIPYWAAGGKEFLYMKKYFDARTV